MQLHLSRFVRACVFTISALLLPALAGQSIVNAQASEVIQPVTAEININTASPDELADGLNGVGLKKAEAIVVYRDANGKFTSIDQLLNVKGIGEATLNKNRSKIVL